MFQEPNRNKNEKVENQTKNIDIYYQRFLNIGLEQMGTHHRHYLQIQQKIKKCSTLVKGLFGILNNYDDFTNIMVELQQKGVFESALSQWKGFDKNAYIMRKYYPVFVVYLRRPEKRIKGARWTTQLKKIMRGESYQALDQCNYPQPPMRVESEGIQKIENLKDAVSTGAGTSQTTEQTNQNEHEYYYIGDDLDKEDQPKEKGLSNQEQQIFFDEQEVNEDDIEYQLMKTYKCQLTFPIKEDSWNAKLRKCHEAHSCDWGKI